MVKCTYEWRFNRPLTNSRIKRFRLSTDPPPLPKTSMPLGRVVLNLKLMSYPSILFVLTVTRLCLFSDKVVSFWHRSPVNPSILLMLSISYFELIIYLILIIYHYFHTMNNWIDVAFHFLEMGCIPHCLNRGPSDIQLT